MRIIELLTARFSLFWWPDTLTLLADVGILLLACLFNANVASLHGLCESILLLSVMWYGENSMLARMIFK
jgi:hypothetical protein